ncbi:hypothetical protein Taro_034289 [Colocasia esculenta]|uniref:Uncharacterized protein n=1 Tax=Colocasia esculenta TaxID=4460 RepID=A0A843VXE9_COLES|nr:hypothetical protein [Colocasia esculenta]
MGQPVWAKNLKKISFSLVGNVWTKTSVVEGEAIIGEASEAPSVPIEEAAVREDEPPASERRIEDITLDVIEPVGQYSEGVIPPQVSEPAISPESVIDQLASVAHIEVKHEDILIEEMPSVPVLESAMEEIHEDTISEVVAPGHIEDVQMQDAPAQGEPEAQGEPKAQGRKMFRGSLLLVPLQISFKKFDVTSIFLSQSTEAKDIGAVKSELQGMRTESKTKDQWARANKAIYRKFEVARANIFPPSDHPLTLSEWNDPQKTTELFSFGRPEEEKLKSHHNPQREATAPT